jgi:hypothetical protein
MKRVKKNKTVSNFFKIVKRNLSGIVIPVTTSRLHLFFFSPPTFYFNFIHYKWTRNK